MKLPYVEVVPEYTQFIGGLNQEAPYLTFPAGALIAGQNYVSATEGGYRRIDGYERFDGRTSPSAANYYYFEVTLSATVTAGDTITGAVSTETAVVVSVGTDYLVVTKLSGTFTAGENITVSGSLVGVFSLSYINGHPEAYGHAVAQNATADVYRADITKPSGDLPVRGVIYYKDVLYAFVDNAAGTVGKIYKSTTSGWSEVSLYSEISYTTGVAEIFVGDTVTQLVSGATAEVKKVILESGAWGSTAAGRLILTNITGTFNAVNDLQVAAATKVTASSLVTAITISPGGRYELLIHNFSGATDTRYIYGCDGVNRGFEFDGDVYAPINLPALDNVTDAPTHIKAHKLQLFLSIQAASFNSEPGNPFEYTAISGTIEIALGDDITGYEKLAKQILGIFSRHSSGQLAGTNADDFVLDDLSAETGAIAYTIQKMGPVFVLDDSGIIAYTPTDAYGNFAFNTISRVVQKTINDLRKVVTASAVYHKYDQYRLYGSDGTGLCMTKVQDQYHFSFFRYEHNVSCTFSGESLSGEKVVFFGTSDGWVMQADKGSSFDGEPIEAFLITPFNNQKMPTVIKTYRYAVLEMVCESYSPLKISAELSYGDSRIAQGLVNTVNEEGPGGFFDVDNWEDFFYDKQFVNNPLIPLQGDATNLGITVYSNTDIDLGHKIDGIIVHYTPRRLQR